jgi:hypothetical protein
MPYIEVWVDDEVGLDKEQWKAIRDLVGVARDIAQKNWLDEDYRELNGAAEKVVRMVLMEQEHPVEFPVDKKYREWCVLRSREGASA